MNKYITSLVLFTTLTAGAASASTGRLENLECHTSPNGNKECTAFTRHTITVQQIVTDKLTFFCGIYDHSGMKLIHHSAGTLEKARPNTLEARQFDTACK